MAASPDQSWKGTHKIEKELHAKLAEKDATYQDIDHILTQHRLACQNLIFQDFEFAQSKNVEARLWDAHGRINSRFRKNLARLRTENGKKKPVEMRKLIKYYLEFIKGSQRFYRTFIQRLASHFGGIPGLDLVAHRCKLDTLSVTAPVKPSEGLQRSILVSCYQTLIRLGDLSRYRETEINTKDYNWGPAIGYYDLANVIYPASGASHHQSAVVAVVDGNHVKATYHLYRALAAEEPHPAARGNLEIEFKKILTAWTKGEAVLSGSTTMGDAGKALLMWFVRLHARCYKGEEFTEHDELENEVLSQLAIDLKERSLDTTLQKFVLINIAAEYCAGVRLQEDPSSRENVRAYFYFLRLNIKTFFTLLQVLQPELERVVGDDVNASNGTDSVGHEAERKLTAVTRRILPGLRLCSSWLLYNSTLLVGQVDDHFLNVQIRELWRVYANSLTLLATTFPAGQLPSVDYLLDEDQDTLGFKPFKNDRVERRYFVREGQRRPRLDDAGVERHLPHVEMLSRIRDLLTDGLELAIDEKIPIALVEGNAFAYQEDGLPSEMLASPQVVPVASDAVHPRTEQPSGSTPPFDPAPYDTPSEFPDASSSTSVSMSANMHHMVDSLVEPSPAPASATADETSYGPRFGTLTAASLEDRVHGFSQHRRGASHELHHLPSSPHTPRPSLPSILNTPFAPDPQEQEHARTLGTVSPASATRPSTASGPGPAGVAGSAPRSPLVGVFPPPHQQHSSGNLVIGSSMPTPTALQYSWSPGLGIGVDVSHDDGPSHQVPSASSPAPATTSGGTSRYAPPTVGRGRRIVGSPYGPARMNETPPGGQGSGSRR
ncbi:MAG: hypothetical protein M1817_006415 [Caeruleum heppii]|nr:MAG: hypothetical protein M1817_006415 [Caeruleum heppii]